MQFTSILLAQTSDRTSLVIGWQTVLVAAAGLTCLFVMLAARYVARQLAPARVRKR